MELRDYLQGLRRYWLIVVAATVVGVIVAFGWTLTQPRVYEASAQAYISTAADAANVVPGQGNSYAQSYVASFTNLAGWRSVADSAAAELKLSTPPEQLASQVTVTNPEDTPILTITARAATPKAAAALAGAWVHGLQSTIDDVNGTGKKGSAPVNVFLGDPAAANDTPVSPDVRTALIVGGIIGFGIGIAFGLVRTASDRRIRRGDDINAKLGLSVVGTIPDVEDLLHGTAKTKRRRNGPNPEFAFTEALRVLRTNLQFMDVDNPPRTIVITSPLPGDGKSTIACELAKTLAAAGTRVILIDGDLRRPRVAKTLGLPDGAGLTDVLAGRAEITDVLQYVPGSPTMLALTAGSTPPNPSEVLGSARMHDLLDELSGLALVIIDAPPLLAVTDGAVLAHQADGALLVVGAGRTTYDLAEKALGALDQARGRALGVVLNRAALRGPDASPYTYAYTYDDNDGSDVPDVTPAPARTTPRVGRRTTPSAGTTAPTAPSRRGAARSNAEPIQWLDTGATQLTHADADSLSLSTAPVRTATGDRATPAVGTDTMNDAERTFASLLAEASAGAHQNTGRTTRR